jgi:hypothetical protein
LHGHFAPLTNDGHLRAGRDKRLFDSEKGQKQGKSSIWFERT